MVLGHQIRHRGEIVSVDCLDELSDRFNLWGVHRRLSLRSQSLSAVNAARHFFRTISFDSSIVLPSGITIRSTMVILSSPTFLVTLVLF